MANLTGSAPLPPKDSATRPSFNLATQILLIGYLVAPKIGVFDLSVACLLAGYLLYARRLFSSASLKLLMGAFFLILVVIVAGGVINQVFSPDLALKPIRNILILLFLFPMFRALDVTWEDLFKVIVIAGALNSVVVLLQFVFVLLGLNGEILRFYPAGETEGGLRQPGLSSGYPSSGLLSCIAAVTALAGNYFRKDKSNFFWFIACLPGIFLSARTAVLLFIVGFAAILFVALRSGRLMFLARLGMLSAALVSLVGGLVAADDQIYEIFYIMFEFVFVYLEEDQVGVRSTDDLMENHYFLPEGISEWLVGNGKTAWGDNGIPSDVWFVQNLVGSGLIVTTLYLAAYCYMFWAAARMSRGYQRLVVVVAFAFVFISSFKASFIFSRFVGDVATLLGIYGLASMSGRQRTQEVNGVDPSPTRTS